MMIAAQRFELVLRLERYDVIADRWSLWAQSLAARHQRVAERRGSMALTLAERTETALNLSQRWESRAWQISPQIRLSISALVGESVAEREREVVTKLERTWKVEKLQAMDSVRSELHRTMAMATERAAAPDAYIRSVSLTEPLLQVFRRFALAENPEALKPILSATVVEELRRRIVEERHRVELRPRGEGALRRRTEHQQAQPAPGRTQAHPAAEPNIPTGETFGTAALVFNQPVKTEQSLLQQARSPGMSAQGRVERQSPPATPQAPPINLDQIADQVMQRIDHRIVAYRERLGRPGY